MKVLMAAKKAREGEEVKVDKWKTVFKEQDGRIIVVDRCNNQTYIVRDNEIKKIYTGTYYSK
ncbi:MAG: hypothetical protein NC816_00725 [Candidatus Omnitrophica bacterium]|nr:hypothetical protein [Candidatus Omnitrophota bacterium]